MRSRMAAGYVMVLVSLMVVLAVGISNAASVPITYRPVEPGAIYPRLTAAQSKELFDALAEYTKPCTLPEAAKKLTSNQVLNTFLSEEAQASAGFPKVVSADVSSQQRVLVCEAVMWKDLPVAITGRCELCPDGNQLSVRVGVGVRYTVSYGQTAAKAEANLWAVNASIAGTSTRASFSSRTCGGLSNLSALIHAPANGDLTAESCVRVNDYLSSVKNLFDSPDSPEAKNATCTPEILGVFAAQPPDDMRLAYKQMASRLRAVRKIAEKVDYSKLVDLSSEARPIYEQTYAEFGLLPTSLATMSPADRQNQWNHAVLDATAYWQMATAK